MSSTESQKDENTHEKFVWHFTVLETHLDTFGHMNHATYLQLFEQARWEFITARGYGLERVKKEQVGPTILALNIEYKRELRLREPVKVESETLDWNGKIGHVRQRMLNEKNEDCAILDLTLALFDMRERKIVRATDAWLEAIGLRAI